MKNPTRAVLCALAIFTVTYACKKKTDSQTNSSPNEDRLIYSLVGPDTFAGKDPHSYAAYAQIGNHEILKRTNGNFIRKSGSGDQYVSDLTPASKLEVICKDSVCDLKATIQDLKLEYFVKCSGQVVSLPKKPLEFVTIPCEPLAPGRPNQHLAIAMPKNSEPLASRPHTAFEFTQIGTLADFHEWKVPVVDARKPIKFRVDAEILKHEVLTKAIRDAIKYWNEAAGKILISDDLSDSGQLSFDFLQSQIQISIKEGGTLASANNLADPTTGEILAIKLVVRSIPESYKEAYGTLVHELGHGLSLRHNFAASHDPKAAEFGGSTSVMDYLDPEFEIRGILPYDRAAMRYLYYNEKPTQQFLHCNDSQVPYMFECGVYDAPYSVERVLSDLKTVNEAPNKAKILENLAQELADFSKEDLDLLEKNDKSILVDFQSGSDEFLISSLKHLWYNKNLTANQRAEISKRLLSYFEDMQTTNELKTKPEKSRLVKILAGFVKFNPFTVVKQQ